jgi:hypothetical protein
MPIKHIVVKQLESLKQTTISRKATSSHAAAVRLRSTPHVPDASVVNDPQLMAAHFGR